MPALLLAEVTPLTQDQAFGLYCGILLMTTTMLINRTAVAGLQTKLHKHELAVTCVIYTLGYLMNGRLCPAFLGSAILMRAHVFWCRGLMTTPRVLIHNFFALPLMTVSSGTFIVGFATILAWLTMAVCDLRMANHRIRLRPLILLGMIPVVFLAGVQGSLFVTKLHDYYQGDMIQVLYHGYGDLLQRYMPGLTLGELTAAMIATVPVLILIIAATLRQFSWTHVYLLVSTCLTVLMGACGYSTMLTNTPTVVLCGALILARQAIPPQQITLKAAA